GGEAGRSEVRAGVGDVMARMLAKGANGRPQPRARVVAELQPWLSEVPPPTPDEIPNQYTPHRDVDTQARHSTAAMVSKSSRALIMKTMAMVAGAEPVG